MVYCSGMCCCFWSVWVVGYWDNDIADLGASSFYYLMEYVGNGYCVNLCFVMLFGTVYESVIGWYSNAFAVTIWVLRHFVTLERRYTYITIFWWLIFSMRPSKSCLIKPWVFQSNNSHENQHPTSPHTRIRNRSPISLSQTSKNTQGNRQTRSVRSQQRLAFINWYSPRESDCIIKTK